MQNKFLHIGCGFASLPKTFQIDALLNVNGIDWVRYAPNNWIVWTNKSAPDIASMVRSLLQPEDQVLVAGLNTTDRSGVLVPWLWQWIDARMIGDNRTLADILYQGGAFGTSPNPLNQLTRGINQPPQSNPLTEGYYSSLFPKK